MQRRHRPLDSNAKLAGEVNDPCPHYGNRKRCASTELNRSAQSRPKASSALPRTRSSTDSSARRSSSEASLPSLLEQFRQSFVDIHQPANDGEYLIVEEIVAAKWRLRRVWSIETRLLQLLQFDTDTMQAELEADYDNIDIATRIALAYRKGCDNSRALANPRPPGSAPHPRSPPRRKAPRRDPSRAPA